jgi:hypothetical protein
MTKKSTPAAANANAKFQSPFPPLELSVEDEAQLEGVAQLFVHNMIAQYQKYQLQDHHTVDRNAWKLLRRKENICAYIERCGKETAKRKRRHERRNHEFHHDIASADSTTGLYPDTESSVASSSPASRVSNASQQQQRQEQQYVTPKPRLPLDLPVILVVGTMEGTVQDIMLGAVNPTVDEMRVKTSYVNDTFVDAAVLATLITPTPNDPFRSLSIKWLESSQSAPLDKLVKNRDSVVLESTGITQLANGESVGYMLLHTVHLPQTQPLPGRIRRNISICCLVRQHSPTTVEIFLKAYLNPLSGLMRTIIVKNTVYGAYSVWNYVHCGRMKKLAWALEQQNKCPVEQLQDNYNGKGNESCVNCKKRPTRHRFRTNKRFSTCKLCFEHICDACAVKKKLSYVAAGGVLQQKEITLCALCVHSAMIQTDTKAVASEKVGSTMPALPLMKNVYTASSVAISDKSLFDHRPPW